MREPRALLDVSVPMYAAGREHPLRESCVWLMAQIAAGDVSVAIDTEITQEVLHRYGALQQWQIAVTMASNLLDIVTIVHPILPADAQLAIGLFERYAPRGVRSRDVIHAAVMRNNGLAQIISTDEHFDQIDGVVRLDPRELYQAAGSSQP